MEENIIKVYNLCIYYMKKVDSDGNVYRLLMDKDKQLVSEIQYWCTDLEGNLNFYINDERYTIEYETIKCIPVDNYRSLQVLRKNIVDKYPFRKWEHLLKHKPDMVCIQRQKRLDSNGNFVYHMYYLKNDGENVTHLFKFWRLIKGEYQTVNCYLEDKWFKKVFDNKDLIIKRTED